MEFQSAAIKTLLFLSGFIILALEILGVRILGPYTGTSVPVWAAIISVTLVGSSLGYYGGGFFADRTQKKSFFLGMVVVASLFIAIIPDGRSVLHIITPFFSYEISALIGASILLLIPTICLSAIITYAIRILVKGLDTIAQVHGDMYGLATIGSAVGVFGTSYLLVPLFSVPHILYGFAATILFCGIAAIAENQNE